MHFFTWCEHFCGDDIFGIGVNFWAPRQGPETNTEIVKKIVPVRAVDLSIGPFCTEFLCERFCDDAAS